MSKKKRTKVAQIRNTSDFNQTFAAILKAVDQMDEKEVDKMLGN
jgi:hypothetical protein